MLIRRQPAIRCLFNDAGGSGGEKGGGGRRGGEGGEGEDEKWLGILRVLLLVMMSIHATAIQSLGSGVLLRSQVPFYDHPPTGVDITLASPPTNDTHLQPPLSATGPKSQTNSAAPVLLLQRLLLLPVRRSASAAAAAARGAKEDGSAGDDDPTPSAAAAAQPPAPPPPPPAADKLARDVRSFETGSEPAVHRRRLDTSPQFPVTFRTSGAYLVTKLKVYATFGIQFKLKTTQLDGLILYSGYGFGKDFMAVELSGGYLRYVFDVGSGPRTVEARSPRPVNDNEWHDVSILRPTVSQHIVQVDDTSTVDNLPDTRSVHYDLLADDLYIGGVERAMYNSGQLPKQVRSRLGFQGCLASIDLNKQCWNIDEHHADIPKELKEFVTKGCEGPKNECSDESCQNGGICQQHWDSFSCQCDQTSFTGPTCSDDSIAYTFGQLGGIISFTFAENERPDTKTDQLTMGFSTIQLDALLLRIASATSNDFIEVELIDGALYVVYYMGINNHPIGDIDRKVNDGNYHVLRFSRSGQNASIQIDNFPPLSKHPPGRQLMTTFNHQGSVLIGGKKEGVRLVRPFHGVIAGLVLNKLWLLELAAEGDRRVAIEGDVELEISPLRSYYISLSSEFSTRSVEPTFLRPTNKPSSQQITTSSFNSKHVPKGSQSDSASDLSAAAAAAAAASHCKDGDHQCIEDISKAPVIHPQQKATHPPPAGKSLTSPAFSTVPGRGRVPGVATARRSSSSAPPCASGGGFDDEDCDQSSGTDGAGGGGNEPRRSLQSPTFRSASSGGVFVTAPAFPSVTASTPHSGLRRSTAQREGMLQPASLQAPGGPTDGGVTLPTAVVPPNTKLASFDPGRGHSLEGTVGPPDVVGGSKAKGNHSADGGTGGSQATREGERTGTGDTKGGSSSSSLTPGGGGATASVAMNIGLIAGISVGVLVLLVALSCAVYKWRSREEGTYSLEAAAVNDYGYEACLGGGGGTVYEGGGDRRLRKSKSSDGGATGQTTKTKKRQTKEWYV